jgi:lipopolysaccharide/colanic/teichoic acid biosynthesis glycosyltransferase
MGAKSAMCTMVILEGDTVPNSAGNSVYRRWGKRTLDIVLGSLLAVLALPLILLLSLGSAVAFGAWPIFVQPRVGREGRLFRCLKIRSLPVSAPPSADRHELAAVRNCPFGRFLRTSHLDELPQLLLVPLGTMSLVGPRPAIPELLEHFHEEAFADRCAIRPGCTGLWQVSDAGEGPIYGAPEYDQCYLRDYSLRLDVEILARTVGLMLRGARPTRSRTTTPAGEALAAALVRDDVSPARVSVES